MKKKTRFNNKPNLKDKIINSKTLFYSDINFILKKQCIQLQINSELLAIYKNYDKRIVESKPRILK